MQNGLIADRQRPDEGLPGPLGMGGLVSNDRLQDAADLWNGGFLQRLRSEAGCDGLADHANNKDENETEDEDEDKGDDDTRTAA